MRRVEHVMMISQARIKAKSVLAPVSQVATLEADLLLCFVLKKPRPHLIAWSATVLSHDQLTQFLNLVEQRASGLPLAYLLGEKEFWGERFWVTPDTLIPRPETELLVAAALEMLPSQVVFNVLDLGTGSGAIAVSIAKQRPLCHIVATDFSDKALSLAKKNAQRHNLTNIEFVHSDWFSALTQTHYQVIVANPPYVSADDPHLVNGDIRFEPPSALVAKDNGLAALTHIIKQAGLYLDSAGWLMLEHGWDQGQNVQAMLTENHYQNVTLSQDLAGLDRMSMGQWAPQ